MSSSRKRPPTEEVEGYVAKKPHMDVDVPHMDVDVTMYGLEKWFF